MDRSQGFVFAAMAGSMAALGSVAAKLAFSGDVLSGFCKQVLQMNSVCDQVTVYLQLLMFAMVFVCNALMWTLFTKSLQLCSSSVEATVTNTATNFLITAMIGWVLFDERLSLRWFCGSLLILGGLLLIHRGNVQDSQETDKAS